MERDYPRIVGILVAGAMAIVTSTTWLVDPFSLFGAPHIAGFNADKVEFLKYLRLTKPYAVFAQAPKVILIGTSRAGRGLSAGHPGFHGMQAYNVAVPALTMYEAYRLVQHAHAVNRLEMVVLGLDFRMFTEGALNGAFSEDRLLVTADGSRNASFPLAYLSDMSASLTSAAALKAALQTVRYQGWSAERLFLDGRWDRDRPGFDHANAFRAYIVDSAERLAQLPEELCGLRDYARLLEFAHREDIELKLFISPSHAAHWVLLNELGVWQRFIELKRRLIEINISSAEIAGTKPFPIWDFSGINKFSLEEIAVAGMEMTWFWESVHYKRSLGDKILDLLLDERAEVMERGGFGVRLDRANIEAYFREQTERLSAIGDDQRFRFVAEVASTIGGSPFDNATDAGQSAR